MAGGWVKFHRQIEGWQWYQDGNTFRLFFHLILKANHEPKKWQGIIIDRGQRVTSYPVLGLELGITARQARTALEHLKMSGEVSVKTSNKYTLITVNNYAKYQALDEEEPEAYSKDKTGNVSGKKSDKSQANVRLDVSQMSPNKNEEEDKNIKKNITRGSVTDEPAEPSPTDAVLIPYQEIANKYNALCPRLPKVRAVTEIRHRAMKARWNTCRGEPMAYFTELFTKAGQSDFLAGANVRAWIADFDWLLKEQNSAKVLEGKYDNSAKRLAGRGKAADREGGHVVDGRYRETVDDWSQYFDVVEDGKVP